MIVSKFLLQILQRGGGAGHKGYTGRTRVSQEVESKKTECDPDHASTFLLEGTRKGAAPSKARIGWFEQFRLAWTAQAVPVVRHVGNWTKGNLVWCVRI
jgi:hypothetical protein